VEVTYPDVAVVYDGQGVIRRKIVPGFGESAQFDTTGIEGVLLLRGPPYDDAACRKALSAIFGGSS
jgi:hypothetical protein